MAMFNDPLGLKALEAAVADLREESGRADGEAGARWRELAGRLEAAHAALALKMELLRDRYGLLKQSSAQLADEVAWLRDQLDDIACAEPKGERPAAPAEGAPKPQQRSERRYTDRWKGRR